MPRLSDEIVRQAREVDLLTYLQEKEPWELRRSGTNEYRTESHGSLVISNGLWIWNRGGVGGASALDYLIKIRGMGFVDAVEMVTGIRASPSFSSLKAKRPEPKRKDKPLILPPPVRFPKEMVSYLQGRGIHPDVVKRCKADGSLYEGRYGGETVCMFVGRETGKERFGCMRGIHSDLKRDCTGSDKRFSFHLPAIRAESRHLAVFEAPIDVLSHASLQIRSGWVWDGYRLSLGGTSPVALVSFLERYPDISRVILHLDNDPAGLTAARKIKMQLQQSHPHIRVSVNPPHQGAKDYNDFLLCAIRSEREREEHRSRDVGFSL